MLNHDLLYDHIKLKASCFLDAHRDIDIMTTKHKGIYNFNCYTVHNWQYHVKKLLPNPYHITKDRWWGTSCTHDMWKYVQGLEPRCVAVWMYLRELETPIDISNDAVSAFCGFEGGYTASLVTLIRKKLVNAVAVRGYGYHINRVNSEPKKLTKLLGHCHKLISPDGKEHKFVNVLKFCEQQGLSRTSIYRLLQGQTQQHKGWKLK